jgi:hydroxymethylbilane synthase
MADCKPRKSTRLSEITTVYKIGTRGSLLAVTQATITKNKLEELTGEKFELVLIKTQGDQIVDRPLWQLEGKDFFTKELDAALLTGEVDLVIHSYKDLGSERPQGIQLAAITERQFAHDVLLTKKSTVKKLNQWTGDFVVGTSSPRRIVNLTSDLSSFIPSHPKIRCETLRGNINTRIQKLKDDNYHAITLALAGVERLAHRPDSLAQLTELLDGLTFAVLPQSVFPSAASQGALGIEVAENRQDQGRLLSLIQRIHHAPTAEEVRREREAFKSYGGGCHLAVGIHVREFAGSFLHFHKGSVDDKKILVKKREGVKLEKIEAKKVFLGTGEASGVMTDTLFLKHPSNTQAPVQNKHVFVTTALALQTVPASAEAGTVWAAGPETRKKLVEKGFWVHGGADGMGHAEVIKLRNSKALQLMMGDAPWLVLSHDKATSPLGEVFAAYTHEMKTPTSAQVDELKKITHAWWASFPQFEAYTKAVPELKHIQHYCGLGKTFLSFNEKNITVTALTDHKEFLTLLGKL